MGGISIYKKSSTAGLAGSDAHGEGTEGQQNRKGGDSLEGEIEKADIKAQNKKNLEEGGKNAEKSKKST